MIFVFVARVVVVVCCGFLLRERLWRKFVAGSGGGYTCRLRQRRFGSWIPEASKDHAERRVCRMLLATHLVELIHEATANSA